MNVTKCLNNLVKNNMNECVNGPLYFIYAFLCLIMYKALCTFYLVILVSISLVIQKCLSEAGSRHYL